MGPSEYISLGAVIIAILALAWQVKVNNDQSKMQTFLTYTQRYQNIVINLPIGVESENFSIHSLSQTEKEDMLRWMRAYFDLCSEEYFLHESKLIDDKAWNLWKAGMIDSLKKSAFSDAWREIQFNKYYNQKFAHYIEALIA